MIEQLLSNETLKARFEAGAGLYAQPLKWVEESKFVQHAFRKNPKLAMCTPASIRDTICLLPSVGLTLNPVHGYCNLEPRGVEVSKGVWEQECRLDISYKGLCKIATDSGACEWIKSEVVREKDTFTYEGVNAVPNHKFSFGDRGDPVGVYCVAKLPGGDYITEVADWSEAMKAKGKAKRQHVWVEWEDEMAKKFVCKRASKSWPHNSQMEAVQQVIQYMHDTEGSLEEGEKEEPAFDALYEYLKKEAEHGRLQEAYMALDLTTRKSQRANMPQLKEINDAARANA